MNKQEKERSEPFRALESSVAEKKTGEEKLASVLAFMREGIRTGPFRFDDLRAAKRLFTSLLKGVEGEVRRRSEEAYEEVSRLVDRARTEFDAKMVSFIERTEFALDSIDADLDFSDRLIDRLAVPPLPEGASSLLREERFYVGRHKGVLFFRKVTTRLNDLRKEVSVSEIAAGAKGRLLKRISELGDQAFPKRKELVRAIGERFAEDVRLFILSAEGGGSEDGSRSVFDGVKVLQACAKVLPLDSKVFASVRERLSALWDESMATLRSNRGLKKGKQPSGGGGSRTDVRRSRESSSVSTGERERKESNGQLKAFIEEAEGKSLDALEEEAKRVEGRILCVDELPDSSPEGRITEKLLLMLQGVILHRREESATALDEMEDLYEEREALIQRIKVQIDGYRKELGGSALDFTKGMFYRELYDELKMLLDGETEALARLGDRIAEQG
ncbi:MAG: hypothetical protein OXF02_02960 [Simkaniaceae bacterium]|nr:hypothetical protein [Simkaniaceae bacterium]